MINALSRDLSHRLIGRAIERALILSSMRKMCTSIYSKLKPYWLASGVQTRRLHCGLTLWPYILALHRAFGVLLAKDVAHRVANLAERCVRLDGR